MSDRNPSLPSDAELLEFLNLFVPEATPIDRFSHARDRVLALVLYRQDRKLRQLETALGLEPGPCD